GRAADGAGEPEADRGVLRLRAPEDRGRPTGGMKFGPVPLSGAAGKILGHNIAGADGKRILRKGRPLTEGDLEAIAGLGRASVYVAELEPGDVGENEAARRVAQA